MNEREKIEIEMKTRTRTLARRTILDEQNYSWANGKKNKEECEQEWSLVIENKKRKSE